MSYDEMELDCIGDRKTALFVIISDTDDTFNFVVAIMYSQLFNLLCDKADDVYNGRLPVHVRCLLDEFANIGQIPKFDKLIATIRSREISASIILQSQSQLKTIYKDAADTIVGNCDCTLFLGGKEKSTLKELSEILGKETIDLYNTSETRSTNNSYGLNYNWTGDMVADMLQNMVYLGHTVNLRYSTKSYKDKKRCERPKSEWLIFENTHEELVDQETWDIVQEVRSHKRRRTNMDEQNMFSGLVYCADCGKPMVLHRAHTMKPEQNHFTCRTYKKDGAEVCSAHYIREVALKEIVLETIRRATEFARSDPERFAAYIQQKQSTEVAKEIRGVERELSTMRKRDGELDVVFKRMYEDSALGRVSNEQFRLLSEAYSKEKAQLAEAIPATEERLEKLRSSMANAKNFIAKARKFTDMTELTPELLRTFVAKIIVYEKEVKYSKHAPQKIHICFRDFNLNETDDMLLCGETTEKADSTIALPA